MSQLRECQECHQTLPSADFPKRAPGSYRKSCKACFNKKRLGKDSSSKHYSITMNLNMTVKSDWVTSLCSLMFEYGYLKKQLDEGEQDIDVNEILSLDNKILYMVKKDQS